MGELLLAPHNLNLSGLSSGAWEAIDASDNPGTCRCVQLKHDLEAQEKHVMEFFNHKVEVIPLVEVAPNQALILAEVTSQATIQSSNNSTNEHLQVIVTSGSTSGSLIPFHNHSKCL